MSTSLEQDGSGVRYEGTLDTLLPGTSGAVTVYGLYQDNCSIYFLPDSGLFLWLLSEAQLCWECGGGSTLKAMGTGGRAAAVAALLQHLGDECMYKYEFEEAFSAVRDFVEPAAAPTEGA